MTNPFLEALYFNFEYECNGETIPLTDEETSHQHGNYFVVKCDKCCNIPVFHLLKREKSRIL